QTKLSVKDSGWSFVKSWKEPQFNIIRYALGIRELEISQFSYVPTSEFISTPWQSPKEIAKVTLMVDQFIPSEFPVGNNFINYYIKPEIPEAEWIPINPIDLPTKYTEDGKIVP